MPKIKKCILLTGGGTAGHVMPNLALLPYLNEANFNVEYMGSKGIEKDLVKAAGIPFYEISSGKLRRYFSFENFVDVFRIVIGIFQAYFALRRLKPAVVFSKGGFVSVPVSIGAKLNGIPVVSHESDFTPGLANKIISKFANVILYTFPETERYLPKDKSQYVPCPIRKELFTGSRAVGMKICGFLDCSLPVLLVMGGSQGAQRINDALQGSLPRLIDSYRVIHLTGRGKGIDFAHPNYKSFEFLGAELKDIFAITDLVVCRAGANSIFEMLALKIPMLLIPLQVGSRGDQILNAKSFESRGWADTLDESTLSPEILIERIEGLRLKSKEMIEKQAAANLSGSGPAIIKILQNAMI